MRGKYFLFCAISLTIASCVTFEREPRGRKAVFDYIFSEARKVNSNARKLNSNSSCSDIAKELIQLSFDGSSEASGLIHTGMFGGVSLSKNGRYSIFGYNRDLDFNKKILANRLDAATAMLRHYYGWHYYQGLKNGLLVNEILYDYVRSADYVHDPDVEKINQPKIPNSIEFEPWPYTDDDYSKCTNVQFSKECWEIRNEKFFILSPGQAYRWASDLIKNKSVACKQNVFKY